MILESSILAQVALTMLPKFNSRSYLPLFEQCGGIEGFFNESQATLESLCRTIDTSVRSLDRNLALEKARQELEDMDKYGINVCSFEHPDYPELLSYCEDAPLVFFYKGILDINTFPIRLSIVGTRHATSRCQAKVESILTELSGSGHRLAIISGLAFGIDAAAHRASLANRLKTYAVLGHGLHMIYPAAHKNLAEKILEAGGALISEFPCSAKVLPANFLKRNRIVAGISEATLIAESAEKGGAMTTARIAFSYNRDVMAIPGRPEDKWSAGCNRLIKESVAALVENPKDIANILGLNHSPGMPVQTTLDLFSADDNETVVLGLLSDKGNMQIDEIAITTHIPMNELSALFLKLELEGKIVALPGKIYGVGLI